MGEGEESVDAWGCDVHVWVDGGGGDFNRGEAVREEGARYDFCFLPDTLLLCGCEGVVGAGSECLMCCFSVLFLLDGCKLCPVTTIRGGHVLLYFISWMPGG